MKTFDTYEIIKIKRTEIHGADYNPRKISPEARKKLKAKIKKYGLVQPIIVNKRTMNIVGGHQRVSVMDEITRGGDYELTAAMIDVEEREEAEINIFLNNPSAMGEWDQDLLAGIKELYPDMDFIADLGFDKIDLEFMFTGTEHIEEFGDVFAPTKEQKKVSLSADEIRDIKNKGKEDLKKAQDTEADHWLDDRDNYVLSFVFNNNAEKKAFMDKIKRPANEKFVKAGVLIDILKPEYRF
jgi:hypothetical protein